MLSQFGQIRTSTNTIKRMEARQKIVLHRLLLYSGYLVQFCKLFVSCAFLRYQISHKDNENSQSTYLGSTYYQNQYDVECRSHKNQKPSRISLYALRKNTTYSLRHNLLHKKNSQRNRDNICHEKRRNVLSKLLEIFAQLTIRHAFINYYNTSRRWQKFIYPHSYRRTNYLYNDQSSYNSDSFRVLFFVCVIGTRVQVSEFNQQRFSRSATMTSISFQ